MPLHVRKEGLLAPLFFLALMLAAAAEASEDLAAGLQRCADLENGDERLACFDALAALHAPAAAVPQVANPPPEVGPPATVAVPAGTTSPAGDAEAANAMLAQPADNASPTTPVAGPERADSTGATATGDEKVAQPADEEPAVVRAVVSRVTRPRGRKLLYFEFESGEVWRQMESGYIQYPKDRPFEVEIRTGFMGDHQLRVEGKGRMTRIVRVQ